MKSKYVLSYSQDLVGEPIIYTLIKEYGIKLNILRAEVTPGQEGRLLLEFEASDEAIVEAISYLGARGIECVLAAKAIDWEEESCIDCGSCVGVCYPGALALDPGSAKLGLNRDACVGCGLCVKACPLGLFALAYERV